MDTVEHLCCGHNLGPWHLPHHPAQSDPCVGSCEAGTVGGINPVLIVPPHKCTVMLPPIKLDAEQKQQLCIVCCPCGLHQHIVQPALRPDQAGNECLALWAEDHIGMVHDRQVQRGHHEELVGVQVWEVMDAPPLANWRLILIAEDVQKQSQ